MLLTTYYIQLMTYQIRRDVKKSEASRLKSVAEATQENKNKNENEVVDMDVRTLEKEKEKEKEKKVSTEPAPYIGLPDIAGEFWNYEMKLCIFFNRFVIDEKMYAYIFS